MKALVIGGGGREHALAWKLAQSPRLQTIFVAPGNAGTAIEPRVRNVGITDLDELAEFAVDEKIDLTVVGPETALAAGAVDRFRAKGLRIFGPTRAAAELENTVVVLTVRQAKGLEFDTVIVAEPGQILAESPRGHSDLYVALTRATQRLRVVHAGELPPVLGRLRAGTDSG